MDAARAIVTIAAPTTQPFALFGICMARSVAAVPITSCASLWLDFAHPIAVLLGNQLLNPLQSELPLPIPNDPALATQSVSAQSFHLVGPGLSVIESSPGLRITIQ